MGSIGNPTQSVNQDQGHLPAEDAIDDERRLRRAMRLHPKLSSKKSQGVVKMPGPSCPSSEEKVLSA